VKKRKTLTPFLLGVIMGFFISKKAKTSTKEFARLHGLTSPLRFLHGYFYLKWPKTYVSIFRTGGKIYELILFFQLIRRKDSLKVPITARSSSLRTLSLL